MKLGEDKEFGVKKDYEEHEEEEEEEEEEKAEKEPLLRFKL